MVKTKLGSYVFLETFTQALDERDGFVGKVPKALRPQAQQPNHAPAFREGGRLPNAKLHRMALSTVVNLIIIVKYG